MNILVWILQGMAALIYTASGVMKIFMFDSISKDVKSFAALPKKVWATLGVIELTCVAGLILPTAIGWHPQLTAAAAAVLAAESLVFIAVHSKYRETAPIVMSALLGLVMLFVACERL